MLPVWRNVFPLSMGRCHMFQPITGTSSGEANRKYVEEDDDKIKEVSALHTYITYIHYIHTYIHTCVREMPLAF